MRAFSEVWVVYSEAKRKVFCALETEHAARLAKSRFGGAPEIMRIAKPDMDLLMNAYGFDYVRAELAKQAGK